MTSKTRRKRPFPVSELDEDSTPESYPFGEGFYNEKCGPASDPYSSSSSYLNMNADLVQQYPIRTQKMKKDTTYFKGYSSGGTHGNDNMNPSSSSSQLAVHSFMEQLSTNVTGVPNNHENWFYPFHFHQQY